ncbi:MAG: amidohydrolase, partial [Actinobacteria bacterium]|nr:amidohydrolase [Actinomycetota bacterium]
MTATTEPREDLFLPEPEPRAVKYTVISVDDHLVEPPDMFEGRLESKFADRAPRIVETKQGHQVWEFDGSRYTQVGMNAVAGRRPDSVKVEPFRFEQMRRGCYDIEARVRDMDVNGVWASLNFPSMITGFCGRVFSQAKDPELGAAVTQAWNDWFFEEWYSAHPDRIIPLGITFLSDPQVGAEEVRRN